jgi:hypothetical protein
MIIVVVVGIETKSFAAKHLVSDVGYLQDIPVGETRPDLAIVAALRKSGLVPEQVPVGNG